MTPPLLFRPSSARPHGAPLDRGVPRPMGTRAVRTTRARPAGPYRPGLAGQQIRSLVAAAIAEQSKVLRAGRLVEMKTDLDLGAGLEGARRVAPSVPITAVRVRRIRRTRSARRHDPRHPSRVGCVGGDGNGVVRRGGPAFPPRPDALTIPCPDRRRLADLLRSGIDAAPE